MEVYDNDAHVIEEIRASNLWHLRLGHMGEKGVNMLTFKGRLLDP